MTVQTVPEESVDHARVMSALDSGPPGPLLSQWLREEPFCEHHVTRAPVTRDMLAP